MAPRAIHTRAAPEPGGHYSQAIIAGSTVYIAGSGPFDPVTHGIVGDTIESQTEQTLRNVSAIVKAAGGTKDDIVKVTVYLRDMQDFKRMDSAYARFFGPTRPARTTVQATLFGEGRLIVIDATAQVRRSRKR